jgi:glycosyltransferase involved in cell wall biosynthesis
MQKKIVFISHLADRSGAPIVLLHLLRWLKKQNEFDFIVLLEQGGELETEFQEISETLFWNLPSSPNIWRSRWSRITKQAQKHQQQILNQIQKFAPDIIYGNTIVSVPIGIQLKKIVHCPLVCHVHELDVVIYEYFGEKHFTSMAKDVDFFIAGSKAVAANLHSNHLIPMHKIAEVYEFIPQHVVLDEQKVRLDLRKQLGIADDEFIIAGSGPLDWRKAPDLFIQTANYVHAALPDKVRFIWIGGKLESVDGRRVRHDLNQSGGVGHIEFVGAKSNFDDYMSASDLFLLTSREDPFPLACIQAAALGKPIICFANTGGMPEFIEEDCGKVVPYLRPDLMAEAVLLLYNNKALYDSCSANAREKVLQRHTVELAGSKISDLVNQVIEKIP